MRKLTCWLLAAIMLFTMAGCATVKAEDLMAGIVPQAVEPTANRSHDAVVADFAVRLFKAARAAGEDNTLVSPLSVLYALGLTANGAQGDTLAQMEAVLGLSADELNAYLHAYTAMAEGEEYGTLLPANSVWFTADERLTVERDFLQTNADYYGADAYKVPFDSTTLQDVNDWVKEKTDGRIPTILEEMDDDAVMYLINALAFEAAWADPYAEHQVREGIFYAADGEEHTVTYLDGTESAYIEDENGYGFIKNYAGGRYAFAALLPREHDISLDEYVATLDGGRLHTMLSQPQRATVRTSCPKFTVDYGTELGAVLRGMGMTDAFDDLAADFTALGHSTEGNIFINRVVHNTSITVGERGTTAGAATVIELTDKMSADPIEWKTVDLSSPFVYMLVDTTTCTPLFIGTMDMPS